MLDQRIADQQLILTQDDSLNLDIIKTDISIMPKI